MPKYIKSDILNYIAGNELSCDIDILEADSSFMLEVLKLSKDKHIYNLCDDTLKKNVIFIEGLLDIFKCDFEFCYSVVNYAINDLDEAEKMNLYIIMINNFKKIYDDRINKMKLTLNIFYHDTLISYMAYIDKLKNPKLKKEMGIGFPIILHEYENKPLIKDYFAYRMLEDLYEKIDLEKQIHLRFKHKEDIYKIGIKKYISNSIYGYDEYLAGYIESSNVSEDLERRIKRIINNFDNYENEKLEVILELITDYACDKMLSIYSFTKYISIEFNIPELLTLYNNMVENRYIYDIEEMLDYNNPKTKRMLKELKSIVFKYLKTLEEPDSYIVEESKLIRITKFKRCK